jgi:tetratricopeptide (TPR) repeat protein
MQVLTSSNNRKMNKIFGILLLFAFAFSSCARHFENLEPKISPIVQERYLRSLPSPFAPLTDEEKKESWGSEMQIGLAFARQLDLYQAITAFKRAAILIPKEQSARLREIDYEILLCYYMGKKNQEVLSTFEKSSLRTADQSFPAYLDLLIILYETYLQEKKDEAALQTLQLIEQHYPETAAKLKLSAMLTQGHIQEIEQTSAASPNDKNLKKLVDNYNREKKSPAAAQTLNGLLPGAGYLYLGQKQSALTAFLLNGLFIGAAVTCFCRNEVAAGIIFTSFEAGWYFGGIHGAALETKFYNERVYERNATPMMNQSGLFPVFMLKHSF